MKTKFDNLDDARGKLMGTYCYLDKKAVLVKDVQHHDDNGFVAVVTTINGGRKTVVKTTDPLFRATDYNIGYVNFGNAAAWYYRVPLRQYRQGLRNDQVKMRASKAEYMHAVNFNANKSVGDMLENTYPKPGEAINLIKEGNAFIVAFHRDFAISRNKVHDDYFLEHKGQVIGHTKNLKDSVLMEDFQHLNEKLKEAVG